MNGQNDSVKKPNFGSDGPLFWLIPDSTIDSKICVKVAPLSLLGIYTGPAIKAGLEYKVRNNLSLYNELGFYFLYGSGVSVKLEVKKYFETNKNVGNYLSAELHYKYQAYDASDTIRVGVSGQPYNRDYQVSKHVECLTFKYGNMTAYKFGLVLDAFVGLGIRFRQGQNTLTSVENDNIKSSSDYGPNVLENRAGFFVFPNFDLGVKIGYRF